MRADDAEFYIGYLPHAPRGVARRTRAAAAVLLGVAAAAAIGLAAVHGPFGDGVFEFGSRREFTGTVRERPYPRLLVGRPGEGSSVSEYLLVAPGKFGAGGLVAGLDGAPVRVTGTLAYREGRTLVEVHGIESLADAVAAAARPAPPGPGADLGTATLRGEIVDSKCYLGVMNPGEFKTHRACAIRCIAGGIPPLFVVRAPDGTRTHYLLVDEGGRSVNDRVLGMVADPLEIRGRVTRDGGSLVLRADPATYLRLP